MEGGQDIGTTRMNQGPCIVGSQPAVPVRKLRCEARVEASPQRRCAVLPGVSQEPLQHQIEGAVQGGNLDHFTDSPGPHVVEIPAYQPPLTVPYGTGAQFSVMPLVSDLIEQPVERARVVCRLQRVAAQDIGQMGQHRGGVERVFYELGCFPVEPVRPQPG